ncbi:MAG: nuclear transport factor 2 family protein [Deltaproteobacteria bacterium]|nr:nuclear transport factor 2 family protein [Deltaproteobacteria bacterium]MBW2419089.1 nuclear transport factor 2 family protein [Deltaproteobacteria bacterium]
MTGSEHPNALIAKRAWRAVSEADVDTLRKLWTDDIVWHVTTRNPWCGDHVGQDAVLDYLANLGDSGDAYDSTLDDVLASDERALLVCGVSAARKGHSVESRYVILARFEGEQIAEVWTMPLEPEVLAAYWAD